MKLRQRSFGITERAHQAQHDRSVHDARELYANRTGLVVALDAMSSTAVAAIAPAAIATRADDASRNGDADLATDPCGRDVDRVTAT